MEKSAIIIADNSRCNSSEDRGLLKLDNRALLDHVVRAVKNITDEVIIVISSQEQENSYVKIVPNTVQFALNTNQPKGSLAATLTGFQTARGKYAVLLPFDAPFVSREVISLLFDCCVGKSAVVPRWPSNEIEPLHAVYNTQQVLKTEEAALAKDIVDLDLMICKMRGVRYVSTMVIGQLDPDFRTFFRVKSSGDLKKAEMMKKRSERG